jgi:hypothetical protein
VSIFDLASPLRPHTPSATEFAVCVEFLRSLVSVGFTSYCPIALVQTIATVSTMMMALVPHAMTFWNLVFR